VALEIHKIRDERVAVVSEEGRFVDARRVLIEVVPIANYISATWVLPLRKNPKIDAQQNCSQPIANKKLK